MLLLKGSSDYYYTQMIETIKYMVYRDELGKKCFKFNRPHPSIQRMNFRIKASNNRNHSEHKPRKY